MYIIKKIILIIFLFYSISNGQIKPGAKQISLSHSDIALAHDAYALFNNPAGLSQQNWREISIYYSPSPFGLDKLANSSAVYHEPTKYGSFAIAYTNYGFELYKENVFFVSYSKRIFQNFFVGSTIRYKNISIKNYGNSNSISLLIGTLTYLTNQLRLGFVIDNITLTNANDAESKIPTIFNLGMSYSIMPELSINTSLQKEIDMNISLRVGIDYQIIKYLNLRSGAMNEPSSFSAGVGINYSIFEIDYAIFNHQDLGFTHQIGVTLQFGTDKSRSQRIIEHLGMN